MFNDREKILAGYKTSLREMDNSRLDAANRMFQNKDELNEKIKTAILPSIVFIQTSTGIVGTGFFQHQSWLVSNAHVISCKESLIDARFCDFYENNLALTIDKSYHRPCDLASTPDLVIVNAEETLFAGTRGFPPVELSSDQTVGKDLYFYIVRHDSEPGFAIKFIQQVSKSGIYPMIYQCLDGTSPVEGSSGSPIFEAKVIVGRQPKWQIKIAGVLYARCSATWFNSRTDLKEIDANLDQKLVCAIPAAPDFSMLRSMLLEVDYATRSNQLSFASARLEDDIGKSDAAYYSQTSQYASELAKKKFLAFTSGDTPLSIELPEQLEKLWYQAEGIVHLHRSLLIRDNFEKEIPRAQQSKFPNTRQVDFEDLCRDLNALLINISADSDIKITRKQEQVFLSPKEYFRVDVESDNNAWRLELQDNTGKDSKGKPYKCDKKSLSSTFAMVKILKAQKAISGEVIGEAFRRSEKESVPFSYESVEHEILESRQVAQSTVIGETTLWNQVREAIQNNNFVMLAQIMTGELAVQTDTYGNTPLHLYCLGSGVLATLMTLLDYYDSDTINLKNESNQTALDQFLSKDHDISIQEVLRENNARTSSELDMI